MYKLTLISLLIIVSVTVFVHRIYYRMKKQHFFIRKLMTKIGTFHLFLIFLLYIFYFQQPLQLWMFTFSSVLALPLLIFLLIRFHQQQFHSEFLRFLSLLIIKMQMGLAFRNAYERVLRGESWTYHSMFAHIYENVTFSQQEMSTQYGGFNHFMSRLVTELRGVQTHPHQAIDRLCNFRNEMIQQRFFRRKSSQIWMNFGLQLGVLSFIYWSIFVYVVSQYGFYKHSKIFFLSMSLYFTGFLILFFLMRNKKWRI